MQKPLDWLQLLLYKEIVGPLLHCCCQALTGFLITVAQLIQFLQAVDFPNPKCGKHCQAVLSAWALTQNLTGTSLASTAPVFKFLVQWSEPELLIKIVGPDSKPH